MRRARIGLICSAAVTATGLLIFGVTWSNLDDDGSAVAVFFDGVTVTTAGIAGMIATGILLRKRKQTRRSLEQAYYERPRRVQWDPANSRVVF